MVKYVALHHVSTAKGQKTRESLMTDNDTQSHLFMATFLTQAATSFQNKQIKSYLLRCVHIVKCSSRAPTEVDIVEKFQMH